MGSISSVWSWLIHVPFLGWVLCLVVPACIVFGLAVLDELLKRPR